MGFPGSKYLLVKEKNKLKLEWKGKENKRNTKVLGSCINK
jgi:hypothetical protein